jgi:diaminohydroxyphosphoribosylaminopyrimidine deaminase/5-amino-6-(5-phosphoribosylamino)uracil reductase
MTNRQLDEQFMERAIELSRNGFPAPNPHVGCVIAKDGAIVGEGWHEFAGGPHAEVVALTAAGTNSKGATAYVTLEPCNHHGRTPPCSEALIRTGVHRVVYAVGDPNPKAMGGGSRLSEAGIEVEGGLFAEKASDANWIWLNAMENRRPTVILKAAISLDGRIATASGHSKWITGSEARREAHRLRAECGAVLVGTRTAELDDPELTVRHIEVRKQPVRVVIDRNRSRRNSLKIFNDRAPTLRVTEHAVDKNDLAGKWESGKLDLDDLCHQLFDRGITGLLVEGGAATLTSFLISNLADRIELFVAPKILGSGPSWINFGGNSTVPELPDWQIIESRQVGPDLRVSLIPST